MTEDTVACLLVVGNEILCGQVVDTNTGILAKSLMAVGVRLRRVVVIPDIVEEITEEVRIASEKYSVVFTSGGVGPTHDDVTYSGVAKGLNLKLEESTELIALFEKLFPNQPEARRLATVPSPSELVYIPCSDPSDSSTVEYPVVKARNVYVLPGSPRYFQRAVETIVPQLRSGPILNNIFVDVPFDEFSIVNILDRLAKDWQGLVDIGSYPQTGPSTLTRITLQGSQEAAEEAKTALIGALKFKKMADPEQFTLEDARAVLASGESQPNVQDALNVLQRCYDEYSSDEIFLSFNGGKDCTAVLHLAAAVAKVRGSSPPTCLYVIGDAFPEVETFVDRATRYYNLEMVRKKPPIKSALKSLLTEQENLKAGLMGMRRGDPGSDTLQPMAPTDPGWPKMMRINPILEWTYGQVWKFILEHAVPYCSLYDQGYTSLGAKASTNPNPLLRDPTDPSSYLPAYTLTDGSAERQGRG